MPWAIPLWLDLVKFLGLAARSMTSATTSAALTTTVMVATLTTRRLVTVTVSTTKATPKAAMMVTKTVNDNGEVDGMAGDADDYETTKITSTTMSI